jgi:hypothetical protein
MKSIKFFLAMLLMGVAFVSCSDDNDDPKTDDQPTHGKFEIKISVADGAEDQLKVLNSFVECIKDNKGTYETKNISFSSSWKTQSLPYELPFNGYIKVIQEVKGNANLTEKSEYKVGLKIDLKVYSTGSDEDDIYDFKEFNENTVYEIEADQLREAYPDTLTLNYSIDAKGVVSINMKPSDKYPIIN